MLQNRPLYVVLTSIYWLTGQSKDNDFEKVISASVQSSFLALQEVLNDTFALRSCGVLAQKCWQASKFFPSSLSDQSLDEVT